MAQVFSRRAVLLVKLGLVGVAGLALAGVAVFRWRSALPDARGAPVAQPIPFSHKHHVSDDGIDCRYCHTTVETSRSAGMPSTEICLTCHSQLLKDAPVLAPLHESEASGRPIRWRRVHDLPDFVYFDHSIHVARGVACAECHGPVAQMPLTWREASLEMQWCLDCHRAPERHLHAAGEIFSGEPGRGEPAAAALAAHLPSTRRLTDCSTCHR